MKRDSLPVIFILTILITLSLNSCFELSLSKDSYSPRETLQAEIRGNFLSLSEDNILIYENGTPRSDPVIKGLIKQDNTYYFYAILPNKPGNFSLRIEDAEYIKSGELQKQTLVRDFKIEKSNTTSLSVNPGFFVVDKDTEEITVKMKSLEGESEVVAELEETGERKNFSLIEDLEQAAVFSTLSLSSKKSYLNIGQYKLPVFLIRQAENFSVDYKTGLEFFPSEIRGKVISEKTYFFNVILKNSGSKNLTGINVSSNISATISPNLIKYLESGSNTNLNITIPIEKQTGNLSGELILSFEDKIRIIPISFEITDNKTEVNLAGTSTTDTLDCFEIGNVCIENEECDGDITSSIQGLCCIGECKEKAKEGKNWIYGVILLVVVVVLIFFAYIRLRRKQNSPEDFLKRRSQNFERRMAGSEVRGSLDKI